MTAVRADAAPGDGGVCRACRYTGPLAPLAVREMMFGTRQVFAYEQCAACGSVQIAAVPADLGAYYPPDYYAHGAPAHSRSARVRAALLRWLAWGVLAAPGPVHAAMRRLPRVGPRMAVHDLAPLRGRMARHHRIADVGGGAGALLSTLHALGFRDLTCIDPFIGSSGDRDGIRFVKASLADAGATFDVIMYHHAFEHVVDMDAELAAIRRSLAPGGVALLRIPVAPNVAFAHYGPDWIQLDAPRHLHVPSRDGMRAAAARAGLRITASGDDSTMFQFWGSELYRRDISWKDGAARFREIFTENELAQFARAARDARDAQRGDQGWFLLSHADA